MSSVGGAEEQGELSDESDEDLLPDSLLYKHREIIERHRDALCGEMNPLKVLMQLRKQGLLSNIDYQTVTHKPSDIERNGDILDILYRRGPKAFHELVRCLKSIGHTQLAYTLQPVHRTILWCVTSPTLAATVVHTLEATKNAKFPDFPGKIPTKAKYMIRRAPIFIRYVPNDNVSDESEDDVCCVDNVEVCLVCPLRAGGRLMWEALTAAVEECPRPVVAVMSGVCEGVYVTGVEVCEGQVIIAESAHQSFSQLHAPPAIIETAKQITTRFPQTKKHTREVPPVMPLIGSITTAPTQDSCLACDSNTYQFYDLCARKLPSRTPYLACVGVVNNDSGQGKIDSCAVLSSTVAMEVCKMLVT